MPFQLGIIGDEIGPCVDEWIEWFSRQNPRPNGVEIRTANGKRIHELAENEAIEIWYKLWQNGIDVHGLASGFGKFYYRSQTGEVNTSAVDAHLSMLKRLVSLAEIFKTQIIRGFGLWRDKDLTAMWPDIVSFYREALKLVPEDMVIAIENEAATGLASPLDIQILRREFDMTSRLGILFDPGNIVYDCGLMQAFRSQFTGHRNIEDYITSLAKEKGIALVHIKDCHLPPFGMEAETVPFRKGIVPFVRVLSALRDVGYKGALDLEPHRTPKGQLDEAVRAMPGGEGYGNPEACTEDYNELQNLLVSLGERAR